MKTAVQTSAPGRADPVGPDRADAVDPRVARHLRLSGAWEDAKAQIERDDALLDLARHEGVTVDDETLQAGVDKFREDLGLGNVDATMSWLARTGVTLEEVEAEVEARIVESTLCDRLDPREVEEEFQTVRIRFDAVLLRVFIASDAASARALVVRAAEQDADALDLCAARRMEWGWFLREELPEGAAAQIFKALPGAIVGPLEIDDGRHAVYCVEAFRAATLDGEIEDQLRRELVAEKSRSLQQPNDPRRFVLK